jgi:hypothetical protein
MGFPSIRCTAAVIALAAGAAWAQQNPIARPSAPSVAALNGRWNGVNLERRSACTSPQNEGSRGTYAQFDVVADASGNLSITQSGITGLNCTYSGRYEASGRAVSVQGSYSCTDGKQGSFASGYAEVHALSFDLRLAIKLSGNETCEIDSLLSMARLPG